MTIYIVRIKAYIYAWRWGITYIIIEKDYNLKLSNPKFSITPKKKTPSFKLKAFLI